MKRRTVYKSSVTGRFVTAEFAEANPDTTYEQTILPWRWIQRMKSKRVRE